jgi:hypothetical protein
LAKACGCVRAKRWCRSIATTSFAQIKPAARARIDFGLALKDTKTPKRLIDTGGFAKKDRITRRIEIASVGDIDDEVRRWMKVAYEMDA